MINATSPTILATTATAIVNVLFCALAPTDPTDVSATTVSDVGEYEGDEKTSRLMDVIFPSKDTKVNDDLATKSASSFPSLTASDKLARNCINNSVALFCSAGYADSATLVMM